MNAPTHNDLLKPGTYVLRSLDVYNWGPFGGRHQVEIDPGGTAIIGPTGSGKTTLVDALVTLLVALPRYNLASTGGHESDRDLMSYIRGVSGAGNDTGDNRHVARAGRTVTGLGATFASANHVVQLAALFWIDSTSFASADRKDLWLFSENAERTLDDWLAVHHDGGARAVKELGRSSPAYQVFDTKRAYLTHVRRFFEVGENAFTLLNRAAGLKQLNSIDEIFRELVLDDHSAFNRAAEVAREFDDLAAIHQELELARQQQQSLAPIAPAVKRRLETIQQENIQRELLTILPLWFAAAAQRLWSERLEQLGVEQQQIEEKKAAAEGELVNSRNYADTCHEQYLKLGGGRIEQTNEQIKMQQQLIKERARYAADYQRVTTALKLDSAIQSKAFYANREWAESRLVELGKELEEKQQTLYAAGARHQQDEEAVARIESDLSRARSRPDSNIPGEFQDFRAALAEAMGTIEDALPFVAELIEVKPDEAVWRGAIERAVGAHRLRILAPGEIVRAALTWINQRDNRLHVRLLDATAEPVPRNFLEDGFTRKLSFKPHAMREPMKALLARIDRHCVDTPDALRSRPHSMTVQGLMSGTGGQFEKQDQKPLTQGWVTGFSNKDMLASLERELVEARQNLAVSKAEFEQARSGEKSLRQSLEMVNQLTLLEFDTLDLPTAEARLAEFEESLRLLSDPDSDSGKARTRWEAAMRAQEETNGRIVLLEKESARLDERRDQAAAAQSRAQKRLGEGLTEAQLELWDAQMPTTDKLQIDELDPLERSSRQALEDRVEKLRNQRLETEQSLVRMMERARKIDNGALNDVGTELVDIDAYLERLRLLNDEALPEKQARFQLYLNQSSDQGVTQLLADIDNEISIIEERISELNQTLRKVNFQENRYVQLVPRRVIHESLRTLQRATGQLRQAALLDDGGDTQYRALAHLVALLRDASDNKRTVGARALLDPRYRLQFSYSVIDRTSSELIETRTSSQGGSGGEKEIIASYILTASLSYALCPPGAAQPLFGTIVLDEAFSKSSQSVAGRIISALKEFGLHAVFVTPNKEMRLLRDHTRSAILVHRRGMQATLTSIQWDKLEAHARQRLKQLNEVT